MAQGQVDRVVLFRLAVEADGGVASALSTFEKRMVAVQEKLNSAAGRAAESSANGIGKAAREEERRATAARRETERAIAAESRAREVASREADRREKALIRERDRAHREEIARIRELERERDRAGREEERRNRQAAAEARKNQKLVEAAPKQAAKFGKFGGKAVGDLTSIVEGAAIFGLSGESIEGVVSGLLQVKGATEGIRASLSLWRDLAEGAKAYRATLLAVAAAEKAVAASQIGGAVAGGVASGAGSTLGTAGAAAAGTLAKPGLGIGLRLAGAGAAAIPAALWGTAIAGGAFAGGLATNAFGMRDAIQNRMTENAGPGTVLGWFAKQQERIRHAIVSSLPGSSRSTATGLVGSGHEVADAQKKVEEQQKSLDRQAYEREFKLIQIDRARSMAQAGELYTSQAAEVGRGARDRAVDLRYSARGWRADRPIDYATRATATMEAGYSSQAAQTAVEEARRRGDRASVAEAERTAARRVEEERLAKEAEAKSAGYMALGLERGREIEGRRRGEAAGERYALRGLVAEHGRSTDAARRAELEEQINAQRDRLTQATERELDAAKERARLEHEIAGEKLKTADAAIQKARSEIDLRSVAIQAERDKMLSTAEKFGQLDPGQQAILMRNAKRLQAGEAGKMSIQEIQELQGFGGEQGRLASEEYRRRAYRATGGEEGFRAAFGRDEAETTSRLERERGELEVRLKDQRELKVTLERNDDDLARRMAEDANALLIQHDNLLLQKFQEEVRRMRDQIMVGVDQRLREIANNRQAGK